MTPLLALTDWLPVSLLSLAVLASAIGFWLAGRKHRRTLAQLHRGNTALRRELAGREQAETSLRLDHDMMDVFMRSVPDLVYFKDLQSRFVKASHAMARHLGASDPAEIIGRTDFDFYSGEYARRASEDEQRIIRTGEPVVGLVEQEVFPDGRTRWALTTKLPWRNPAGLVIGTFGVSKNLTDLKNAEEELRQREILFRLIFEHAPVGVAWKRADLGNVYHLNSMFRRILDLPADDMRDVSALTELVHPDDLARHREMIRRIASGTSDSFTVEQRFVLKDGRLVWGRLSVAVVRNEAGSTVQEIAILEDITQRKQTEQELTDTYKSLLDASRVAGMAEVATGVLHNIGNVLNSVNVSVNLLDENLQNSRLGNVARLSALFHENADNLGMFLTSDPKGQRVLPYLDTLADHLTGEHQQLLAEVKSLRRNIDHIKDIVAMQQEYAKVMGVTEILSPVDLVEDAVRMNAAALTRHDVEVVRELPPSAPAVLVERPKVLQILINLIRNAKYALDEGGRPDRRLVLRLEHDARTVRVIVHDNGIGIPPENLVRIFSHGFTTRKDGHGFGLHSSALAAKELGGALSVHSDGLNQGATFTLELPRADAAVPAPTVPPGVAAPSRG